MVKDLIEISELAGRVILKEYGNNASVEAKADNSPLTRADNKSHEVITAELKKRYPQIPILSEEGSSISYQERSKWKRFWCVDPMDGTKEFIKKTGEFTVNIALIEDEKPVVGVIYAPALQLYYFSEKGKGAYKWQRYGLDGNLVTIKTRKIQSGKINIVASRDHAGHGVKKLIDAIPDVQTKCMGSSLKFCLVAEGEADVYYRDVPTFEWDTAASQIIVEEAGGTICTREGQILSYNKQNLRNPALVTSGDDNEYWLDLINR